MLPAQPLAQLPVLHNLHAHQRPQQQHRPQPVNMTPTPWIAAASQVTAAVMLAVLAAARRTLLLLMVLPVRLRPTVLPVLLKAAVLMARQQMPVQH